MEPGEWEPAPDFDSASTHTTEWYSAGFWFDEDGTGEPDDFPATDLHYDDTYYPAAWVDNYTVLGSPGLYWETGVTTFSSGVFGTTSPLVTLPNQSGPEFQYSSTANATWEIHGQVGWGADVTTGAVPDDASLASSFDHMVLRFALLPPSYVELSAAETLMYQWSTRPTEAILRSLTVVSTYTPPAFSTVTWPTTGGRFAFRVAIENFSHSIEILPSWKNPDGTVHFAYWWENTATGGFVMDPTYTDTFAWHVDGELPPSGSSVVSTATTDTSDNAAQWTLTGGALYLSTAGSTAGPWLGQYYGSATYNQQGWGIPYEADVIGWTFSQVADDGFGVALNLESNLYYSGTAYVGVLDVLVVTPTQVISTHLGVETVVATHSTAFATGDQAQVQRFPDGHMTVSRNGTVVSTCTPGHYIGYGGADYGPMVLNGRCAYPWARAANSGNQISAMYGELAPTHLGEKQIYAELDYADTGRSEFQGPPPTMMRWSHAVGYPRFRIEEAPTMVSTRYYRTPVNYYTGEVNYSPVAWVKLNVTGRGFVWTSPVDQRVTDAPGTEKFWPDNDGYSPTMALAYRRPNGDVVLLGDMFSPTHDDNRSYGWNVLDDQGTLGDVGDGYHYAPYDQIAVAPEFTDVYLRIDLRDDDPAWWEQTWTDLWFTHVPRPIGPSNALVWKWQPGDDHEGLQNEGYAHVTAPIKPVPSTLTKGTVIGVEDSFESYLYGIRDVVFGYVEGYGPFYYGTWNPDGFQPSGFDEASMWQFVGNTSTDKGEYHATQYYDSLWWMPLGPRKEYITSNEFLSYGGYTYPANFGSFLNCMVYGHFYIPNGGIAQWVYDTGLYLQYGPDLTTPVFFAEQASTWYAKDPEVIAYYDVMADDAGVFIRANDDFSEALLVSRSSLVWYQATGTSVTLDTWTAMPDVCRVRVNASGDHIKIYANETLISDTHQSACLTNKNCGLWAVGHGTTSSGAPNPARMRTWSLTSATEVQTFQHQSNNGYPALTRLDKPRADSSVIGEVVTGEIGWPTQQAQRYYDYPDRTVQWQVWSKAYPNSIFVQVRLPAALPAFPTVIQFEFMPDVIRQFEINKDTGAVIREMDPFVYDDPVLGRQQYLDEGVNPIVDGAGTHLIGVFACDSSLGRTGRRVVYSLSSGTVVSDEPLFPLTNPSIGGGGMTYLGNLADGREVLSFSPPWRGSPGDFFLYDRAHNIITHPTLQDYVGKGYNDGIVGFDGRYVWLMHLNYHVDSQHYVLTEKDVEGTGTAAGTIVNLRYGFAKFFSEFTRWDLGTSSRVRVYNTWYRMVSGGYEGLTIDVSFDGGVTYTLALFSYISYDYRYFDGSMISIDDVYFRFTYGASVYTLSSPEVTRTAGVGGWLWYASIPSVFGPVNYTFEVKTELSQSLVPIEYVFNMETPDIEQSMGSFVRPEYTYTYGNIVTANQYKPNSSSGFVVISGSATYGSDELQTTGNTSFYLDGHPWSETPYGPLDSYQGSFKVRLVSGPATSGWVSANLIVVLEDGTRLSAGTSTITYLSDLSTSSYTSVSYPFYYPAGAYTPSDHPSAKISYQFQLFSVDPSTVLAFTHINIVPEVYPYTDRDPALGTTNEITGWFDASDQAIAYYFTTEVQGGWFGAGPAAGLRGWQVGSVAWGVPSI